MQAYPRTFNEPQYHDGYSYFASRVRRKNPILDLQRFKPATYLYETLVKAT